MQYAWIDGRRRPPLAKKEHATCPDCGGQLFAVLPVENAPHWRHRSGDCDPWSEPEGSWHLAWKERFDLSCREIPLRDQLTQELHRADILVGRGTPGATVLELQHSSISEDERAAREAFYMREHRMFWLVHIHGETSFLDHRFGISLDFKSRVANFDGKNFAIMHWLGPSKQFIEKWKRANAHVFFHVGSSIYYLASKDLMDRMGLALKKGEFALCHLTCDDFIRAVRGVD
ncbi:MULTISPECIES: competence protein CoiA family protein [unclassified Methylobacterium]|uniref:competence protein CoiA n=1 Tax=unclassified Methylobacterium TaxID=2615210 RepID=UPI0009DEC61A|nr:MULTISPECIES: competence protein CoiA family protein [unclassified Methylobacterium]